jgi:TonB family protein
MTPNLSNVAAYSIQLAVLVTVALVATRTLRLRAPLASLRFWQAAFMAAILLPLLQPRSAATGQVLESSSTFVATSAPIAALTARGIDLAQWILVAVFAGIAVRLLWLGIGFVRLRGMVANAAPDTTLDEVARDLAATLGTRATLTITDDIETPATVGIRRAIILLPRRVLQLSPAVQRAVITHELVHVKRRDWLQTLAEEFWCAVLWFHPAARIIAQRVSLAREIVVDEASILLTRDRRAYAEALLAFSNPQPGAPTTRFLRRGVETHLPGVTPLIGRRHLSQRISLIAEEEVMSRGRMSASVAIALIISATATSSAISAFPMTGAPVEARQVFRPSDGVTLPAVVHEVKPKYTAAAMERKIQGSVWLEAVVLETGNVGDVIVSRSLDAEYGLDQEAIAATKQWKFKPGMKDGEPVAVWVTIELTFTLKK